MYLSKNDDSSESLEVECAERFLIALIPARGNECVLVENNLTDNSRVNLMKLIG